MRKISLMYIWLAFLLTGNQLIFAQTKSTERPNVIIIYIDDLGYGDLSCYGAQAIKTPNVDALANAGMLFTDGHCTSSTCTPSRYAMMTGKYPWRTPGTGILPGDAALIIPTDKITLPKVFKNAGYATGVVGKWHLGLGDQVEKNWNEVIKPGPAQVGFDYSFIFPATADRVPTVFMENQKVLGLDADDPISVSYKSNISEDPTGLEHPELLKLTSSHGHNQTIVNGIGRIGFMKGGKQSRWTDEELGPVFLEKAKNFISNHQKERFFLYYAIHDIHVPRMPSTMFKGKSTMGFRGDAILEMDWAVGELTRQLKELGLYDNTLIIFTSDNGPVLDDGYNDHAVAKLGKHRPAGVLKGGKGSIWEGGNRVPFLLSWPNKIKPGKSDALVSQIDFLASFAGYFGQKIAQSEAADSENHINALLGQSKAGKAVNIEQAYNQNIAIVSNGWKYIPTMGKNQPEQLYHLVKDIGETKNLIDMQPEKAKELKSRLEEIRKDK